MYRSGLLFVVLLILMLFSCKEQGKIKPAIPSTKKNLSAKDILGNPNYLAIAYGGYRETSRDVQPSIIEIKEDMMVLSAMGIKILRTYNVQLQHAPNVLKAISELKKEHPNFEMYVMLGAWINCLNAWTDKEVNHNLESPQNASEIKRAVALAKQYPDIVKIIAVGNEAMVHWATRYYVKPSVILKWVNHLQNLKQDGELPNDLWITSSDDFASWGGGDDSYKTKDLEQLIKAVDFVSMHTYPMHNTHYNPKFWLTPNAELDLPKIKKIEAALLRAQKFAKSQYTKVKHYVDSIDSGKPVHIGETGWASVSNGFYGNKGSKAADEYKSGRYYSITREWTNANNISCFYFEAFNEQWKDAKNPQGSENHFGLITLQGHAKYAIWDLVDQGRFKGLKRNGKPIVKSYNGNKDELLKGVYPPPTQL